MTRDVVLTNQPIFRGLTPRYQPFFAGALADTAARQTRIIKLLTESSSTPNSYRGREHPARRQLLTGSLISQMPCVGEPPPASHPVFPSLLLYLNESPRQRYG